MIRRLGSDITSTFHRYNASSAAIWITLAALASLGCSNTPTDSDSPGNGGATSATSNSEARGGQSASSSDARASGGSDNTQSKSEAKGGTSSANSKSGVGGGSATNSGKTSAGGNAEAGAGGDSAEAGGANATGGTTARTKGSKSSTGGTSTGPKSATGGTAGSSKTGSGGTSASTKDSTGGSSSKSSAGGTSGAGGSSTPAAGGASTSSSTGFNPCPTNGDPCKILPLGDSITYGMASSDNGGYRVPLFKKVIAANQKITFTGTVMAGPSTVSGVTFPKNNEGHSGWTIDQIAGLVPSPAFNTIPNIVLLMAGTNDVYASSGQATMQDRLGTLIDKVIKAAPDALLVVATLTPLSNASWTTTLNTYNSKIPAVIQTRASAGKHVVMVDMSKMPSSQLADGVHPNDTGYAYMADVWYAAIKDVLPK